MIFSYNHPRLPVTTRYDQQGICAAPGCRVSVIPARAYHPCSCQKPQDGDERVCLFSVLNKQYTGQPKSDAFNQFRNERWNTNTTAREEANSLLTLPYSKTESSPWLYHCLGFFFFPFVGHTHGIRKFPGQGSNPSCSCDLSPSFSNAHHAGPGIEPVS